MSQYPLMRPIELFGDGSQQRDFTYVEDIAEGTVLAAEKRTGYEIVNLGGNKPYELNYAIELIARFLGKDVKKDIKPFHKADLKTTWADIDKANSILGWQPKISFEEGIKRSVNWYLENKDLVDRVEL